MIDIPLESGRKGVPWLGIAFCLFLLLWPFPAQPRGGWIPLWWNFAHVPLFCWIGWKFLRVFRSRGMPMRFCVGYSAIIILLMALGTEALQFWTGRTPDWDDVSTDFLAGIAGVCLASSWERRWHQRLTNWTTTLIGIFLILICASPLIQRAKLIYEKKSSFPLLEDFRSQDNLSLWFFEHDGNEQKLQWVQFSNDDKRSAHGLVVPLLAKGLSSLHYEAQGMNWSKAKHLVFDYQLNTESLLVLGVRIDSALNKKQRLKSQVALLPGHHVASVELRSSPENLVILQSVDQLVVFTSDLGQTAELKLFEIRLE